MKDADIFANVSDLSFNLAKATAQYCLLVQSRPIDAKERLAMQQGIRCISASLAGYADLLGGTELSKEIKELIAQHRESALRLLDD